MEDQMMKQMMMEQQTEPNINEQGLQEPFAAPTPGESLTNEAGKNPMEQPPKYTDPEEVYIQLATKFSQPETREKTLEILAAGIPLEILINTIVKQASYSGAITPDVSELLKPALTVFFVDMAQKEGIEVKIFAEGEEAMQQKELEKDQMLMKTLKTQRPEMMEDMQKIKYRERLQQKGEEAKGRMSARRQIEQRSEEMPVDSDGSFLEMGE